MVRTQDPALEAFDHRDNPEAMAKFMESQAAAARNASKKTKPKADKAKGEKNDSPKAGEDQ